jgi:UDP-N-acetylmuramyl pentapeptide synthase
MMSLAAEVIQSGKTRGRRPGKDAQILTYNFKNSVEASQNVSGIIKEGDTVLIKGSRMMAMEKIIEGLKERYAV